MSDFSNKWQKQPKESITKRIKETIRGPEPIKPLIEKASYQIQSHIAKLDNTLKKIKAKDAKLFSKTAKAVQKHDANMSKVYANELAEVRKMAKMVSQAKIVLEQVGMRLHTVKDMGELVVTLAPAIKVIKDVRGGISSIMPEAENEIAMVSEGLGSLMTEFGNLTGFGMSFEPASEEAEKILAEASAIAEQKMKESFPSLPSELTGEKEKTHY
jgi:division protein CdvB (Snf7/Vps24/ESCRT-III family)